MKPRLPAYASGLLLAELICRPGWEIWQTFKKFFLGTRKAMAEIDPETRHRLDGADWDRLYLVLKQYALIKARGLYWKQQDYEQLTRGETAESIVTLAVAKAFAGERVWNWKKDPDLELFLKGVIDSLMHHLVMTLDHRKGEKLPSDPRQLDALLHKTTVSSAKQWGADPETVLMEKEEMERQQRIMEQIPELLRDDPRLIQVLDCIFQDISKPQAIAAATGLAIKDVYQLLQKLNRRLKKLTPDQMARRRAGAEGA